MRGTEPDSKCLKKTRENIFIFQGGRLGKERGQGGVCCVGGSIKGRGGVCVYAELFDGVVGLSAVAADMG